MYVYVMMDHDHGMRKRGCQTCSRVDEMRAKKAERVLAL